jgi:hypothetical protein
MGIYFPLGKIPKVPPPSLAVRRGHQGKRMKPIGRMSMPHQIGFSLYFSCFFSRFFIFAVCPYILCIFRTAANTLLQHDVRAFT